MKSKYDRFARKDFFKGKTREEWEKWAQASRKTLADLLGLDKNGSCAAYATTGRNSNSRTWYQKRKSPDSDGRGCMGSNVHSDSRKYMTDLRYLSHRQVIRAPVSSPLRECAKFLQLQMPFLNIIMIMACSLQDLASLPYARIAGASVKEEMKPYSMMMRNHFLTSSCFHLAHMAEPLGETVIGMCVWDLMKIMDYVLSRTEWDTSQVSCLGFSGGGMQTLYFSALDEQIITYSSVVICMASKILFSY